MCEYGFILFNVIASSNYNNDQFDSSSRRILNSELTMSFDRRRIDEDQPWLPADMSRNMWKYGDILLNVIASFDYNNDQFDPSSRRIFISESQVKYFRRQIDEDQHWLPANM